MRRIKLSRLYYWTVVFGLCTYGAGCVSLCAKISSERGVPELDTLCELEFCTCRDPFGRVRCICPAQDPEEEIILKPKGSCSVSPETSSLSLENCPRVRVIKDAFRDVRSLQSLEFVNVTEVVIEGTIFPSNGASRSSVLFRNSSIPDVPSFAFAGNINSLVFEACQIGVMRSFAFSNIHGADRILFHGTNVVSAEAQAFKKFAVNKFLIIESHFDVIPSRFLADVTVDAVFKIESTYIDAIRTLGFKINNPKKVLVINSMINRLHEEAFKIVARGEIVIENNVFNSIDNEAFRGVSLDRYILLQSGKQKFKFINQTVTSLEAKSLYFNRTAFEVQIERLNVDEGCTCDGLVLWRDILIKWQRVQQPGEPDWSEIWCRMDDTTEPDVDYVRGRQFYEDHCIKLTFGIYFFVIIITGTAVGVLIIVTAIVCIIRRRRRKKWKYVPSNAAADGRRKDHNRIVKEKSRGKKKERGGVQEKPGATKAMIVPDGRTYKETEFHIIVEKAEPLSEECIPQTVVRDRSRTQVNPTNRT